jgi:hypothetical protein
MNKFDYSVENQAGDPLNLGQAKLVPFSQTVRITYPGGYGGFVWNRPSAVLWQSAEGEEVIIPVHDKTRRIQISLLAAAIFGSLIMWITNRLFR